MNQNEPMSISIHTLKRLPYYLNRLKKMREIGQVYVSTRQIANELSFSEMQVKKDISSVVPNSGKPRVGHRVDTLIYGIENFLGYNDTSNAALVGVGHLGKALLSYEGFAEYGINIVLAADNNKEKIGLKYNHIDVVSMEQLSSLCQRMHINIGIITTDKDSAQEVCDQLVQSGIKAIWNFAPVKLNVPNEVIIQNENMASSLAVLSSHLQNKLRGENINGK